MERKQPASDTATDPRPVTGIKGTFRRYLVILGMFAAIAWGLEILDSLVAGGKLDALGIKPRTWGGLKGIVMAPFLHSGFGHLVGNTIPFFILGFLVLASGRGRFAAVSITAIVVSGAGVWLLGGENTVHLGASGLIFGYLGYLLFRGYFERSLTALGVAIVVGIFYGGMLFGLLPGMRGISWLGHVFGFLGGALAAWGVSEASGKRAATTP